MSPEERQALRERFGFRCGYCGVHEHEVGAELTVDHFRPRSRGGGDEQENLIYCCHACNEFKGDYWQPDTAHRLLHPLRDSLADHLTMAEDGTLRGLTETGTYYIQKLHLNRMALVAHRQRQLRREADLAAHRSLLGRLDELQDQLGEVQARLGNLGTRGH